MLGITAIALEAGREHDVNMRAEHGQHDPHGWHEQAGGVEPIGEATTSRSRIAHRAYIALANAANAAYIT